MDSDPFQSAIPEGNWMYPAKLPAEGLPPSFADLGKPPKSFMTAPEKVQAERRTWIEEWLAAMSL
jgi:thiamine transport system substrate-binding protein